jgi:N-acetylneuraminate synthase
LAHEAGADAVKFQHFLASKIVSDYGFRNLGGQLSHQAKWEKPVYEVYEDFQLNRDWTGELAETARKVGIAFMTTPYDLEAVAQCRDLVPAFKIGSGDVTWIDFIVTVARQGKPVILATGASTMDEIVRAVDAALAETKDLILLQCNTNYTGDLKNFHFVNLRVLDAYRNRWPEMLLGLSDHTPGCSAVLGAVALGARVVEKHFTDDNARVGPDHAFSMNPQSWREMIDRCREMEAAFGDGVKRVEDNERETVVVQRRCLRLTQDMTAGAALQAGDLEPLRPAPANALPPWRLPEVVGRRLRVAKTRGDSLNVGDVEGLDA